MSREQYNFESTKIVEKNSNNAKDNEAIKMESLENLWKISSKKNEEESAKNNEDKLEMNKTEENQQSTQEINLDFKDIKFYQRKLDTSG